ncbi:hypothetical protein H8D83_01955, partial [Candidatus Woesearchaeota archaeon]|nr:hypothetical protein [Candidatus Woesearchaeota archaeon]
MDEREVEFSLLEDLKMGEFDFNEGDDYETKVMGSELEKEVGESTINDQARRDAR